MSAPRLTVALPVHRAEPHLPSAFRCLTRQTLRDIEILVVLNGRDPLAARQVGNLAETDPRARIIEAPRANLAAALNIALETARSDLVARMDADDLCPPERLAIQLARMESDPALAALGCAWETIAPDGRVLATVRPPTDPREARWRLLLGNCFAHGSMMLRRPAVLKAGGYNDSCARAQDYELWLRLAERAGLAATPEILYQHRTREPLEQQGSTPEQASTAALAMLSAWNRLPPGDPERIAPALAAGLERGDRPGDGAKALEADLAKEPTRSALLAWLHTQWANPPAPRRAVEACRLSRAREIGEALRRAGVEAVWLWGAGDHTRWLLDSEGLGVAVRGLVDDALAGQERLGLAVHAPEAMMPGETVILSSDWHEEAMWSASASARARGVRVVRFYDAEAPAL